MLEKANISLLNLAYDSQFKLISGLTWFPWVGKNFDNSEQRLLIIGESHYCDKFKVEETKRDPDVTRNVVQHYAVKRKDCNRMFDNLLRCLFQTVHINRENLWQEIAFYNFVQRPMETISERPIEKDMQIGWSVFVDLVKILKPTDCIFVGVAAVNNLIKNLSPMHIPYSEIEWIRLENKRRYARKFDITIDDTTLQCMAIQHTSHHFSWRTWHKFLTITEMPILDRLDCYK